MRYILPILLKSPPWTDLHQIWHSHRGRLHNYRQQFLVISQGVWILWVEHCHLKLTKPVAVNTGLALPRSP